MRRVPLEIQVDHSSAEGSENVRITEEEQEYNGDGERSGGWICSPPFHLYSPTNSNATATATKREQKRRNKQMTFKSQLNRKLAIEIDALKDYDK